MPKLGAIPQLIPINAIKSRALVLLRVFATLFFALVLCNVAKSEIRACPDLISSSTAYYSGCGGVTGGGLPRLRTMAIEFNPPNYVVIGQVNLSILNVLGNFDFGTLRRAIIDGNNDPGTCENAVYNGLNTITANSFLCVEFQGQNGSKLWLKALTDNNGQFLQAWSYTNNPIWLSSQAITFNPPSTGLVGDVLTLSAVGGGSTSPVTFSVVSGPCSVTNSTLTLTGVGSCVVRASQIGDSNFLAAPDLDRTIAVSQINGIPTLSEWGKLLLVLLILLAGWSRIRPTRR